jgi:CBS domain-containing protein
MKLVKHLLDSNSKGREVISIVQEASVYDAIKLMAEHGVGSLLVMDGDELKGIVTERDYARKVIIMGRSSESTQVGEIMTKDLVTTTSAQTVNECMTMMSERRIRHLPVMSGKAVVGLISIGDLVQAIISDQQKEIEQLENYISG